MSLKKWQVNIDYPCEIMEIEAETKEEAEERALQALGEVCFIAEKDATAEAELIEE